MIRAATRLTALLAVLAGVGVFAFTVYSGGRESPTDRCPLGKWLGLPADQCKAVCGVDPTFGDDVRALLEVLHSERKGLAGVLEDPATPDEHILEHMESVIAGHDALERRVARHVLLIRPHLTAEQQKRLMGLCASEVRRAGCAGRCAGGCPPAVGGAPPCGGE
ncbi:MAG: hypothetical protein IMZ44_10465 [Planctomycetes bacterium]|nr:hypothetical protein [Planctomycetota bacterium]